MPILWNALLALATRPIKHLTGLLALLLIKFEWALADYFTVVEIVTLAEVSKYTCCKTGKIHQYMCHVLFFHKAFLMHCKVNLYGQDCVASVSTRFYIHQINVVLPEFMRRWGCYIHWWKKKMHPCRKLRRWHSRPATSLFGKFLKEYVTWPVYVKKLLTKRVMANWEAIQPSTLLVILPPNAFAHCTDPRAWATVSQFWGFHHSRTSFHVFVFVVLGGESLLIVVPFCAHCIW